MTKAEIEREYRKIKYELLIKKPSVAPFPADIVKQRELLLEAQVYLANILEAKKVKDKIKEAYQ